jgi:hypothetical protein
MNRLLLACAFALAGMATASAADPVPLSAEQLDTITAGLTLDRTVFVPLAAYQATLPGDPYIPVTLVAWDQPPFAD